MRFSTTILVILLIACNQNEEKTADPIPQTDTTTGQPVSIQNPDTVLISERIDGPANVRDTVDGKLLFRLYDNVPVTATDPENKWLQVGVLVDLTKDQLDDFEIPKGAKLISDGKEIGEAIENIRLHSASQDKSRFQAEIVGYTTASNIDPNTIPENVLSNIINSATKSLTIQDFQGFIKNFQFSRRNDVLKDFELYEIYENWIDDPSASLRFWLLFKEDKFFGVIHSRPMRLKGAKTINLERGFYFSTFGADEKTNNQVVDDFNSFIAQVD